MDSRPKTLILDIDGVLLHHHGTLSKQWIASPIKLPGVTDKFHEWDRKGYHIVLLTGRRECMRKATETQLAILGIHYHQLVMGVTGGQRVLVNDLKENSDYPTAKAICVERNAGIMELEI